MPGCSGATIEQRSFSILNMVLIESRNDSKPGDTSSYETPGPRRYGLRSRLAKNRLLDERARNTDGRIALPPGIAA